PLFTYPVSQPSHAAFTPPSHRHHDCFHRTYQISCSSCHVGNSDSTITQLLSPANPASSRTHGQSPKPNTFMQENRLGHPVSRRHTHTQIKCTGAARIASPPVTAWFACLRPLSLLRGFGAVPPCRLD